MAGISLCMITKNEEKFLEECLEIAKDFVDEIIVVDTGSTDRTKEIAEKFGAKVVSHEWTNNFSEARNVSLKQATKDWILVLDADERVSEAGFRKIKGLIKDENVDGYRLVQRNYKKETHWSGLVPAAGDDAKGFAGYVPSYLVRLFRNDGTIKFENRVHEIVDNSIEKKGGRIVPADVHIHHYNMLKGSKFHSDKRDFYKTLGEEQIKEKPEDPRAYYETALIEATNGNHENAIEKFRKVIEIDPGYKEAYYNLGAEYLESGRMKEAEEMLKKSIEAKPKFSSAYNLLAIVLLKSKKIKEAVEVLTKGLKADPKNFLLHETLGGIMVNAGKLEIAIKILKEGIAINPRHEGLLINLAGAYAKSGKPQDAASLLLKILTVNPKSAEAYSNLVSIHTLMGKFDKAIETAKNAIAAVPEQKEMFEEQIKALEKR